MAKRGRPPKNQTAVMQPKTEHVSVADGIDQRAKYCLYARKSSESEERQALSIDSQVKEMYKIAERDNLLIIEVLTESHSAKSTAQRPVFNQMVENVKIGKYDAILTWAPDRLSRNAGDLGQLVDLMDDGRLLEIRTYGQLFKNSPNEKFLLMILCSQAKLENDNKSENVKRGLRAACERGWRPGVPPMGYIAGNRKDRPGEIFVDKARAPIIRVCFEKAAEGWSSRKITAWLRSINFTTRGGAYVPLSGTQKMLESTFYYGTFEYPAKSGKWYKGHHKALITKELFDKGRAQIDNRRTRLRAERKSFGFTQLMHCGFCGSNVTAEEHYKNLKDGSQSRYVYYGCNRTRGLTCPNIYIREELLIKQLANIIDQISLDELGIRKLLGDEAERMMSFHNRVMGIPREAMTPEQKDVDIREYAKYLLAKGSMEEKRVLLCNLKTRLVLRNRVIYLEEVEGISWKEQFGHLRKCPECGSKNINESGPCAHWKFGDAPLDDTPRVIYFTCMDCERSWKQVNEGDLRLLRTFTISEEKKEFWIKTPGESEIFVTPAFASRFRDPIKSGGKKLLPKNILGEMVYDVGKNTYRTTLEYEDGSEQTFDIPSLRGRKDLGEGMKPISNKDGLMEYGDR
jgi:DNA invertase Pin-like site-specific DNA recombinase